MMQQLPGTPPPDREWGLCRSLTPGLQEYLRGEGLWVEGVDHVVVLRFDARTSLLCYWSRERAMGYRPIRHKQGIRIAVLGAPERV